MVLIRLAYAADLPLPGDLIKQIKDGLASGAAVPSQPNGGGGGGVRAALGGGNSGGNGGGNVVQAIARQAIPQAEVAAQTGPTNYRDLVNLFIENREATLHGLLYNDVSVVRCEPGLLEIRAPKDAPVNLVARVSKHLMEWTGQRWMVSLTDREGETTLAAQDRAVEKKRRERAEAHPLMQAVIKTFPTAKMTGLRRKPAAVPQNADKNTDNDTVVSDNIETTPENED
jgi:DNA polymerase-3 subunit gamma/tau